MTHQIDGLRRDLIEMERRQSERFTVLDAHFQDQNALLREQNQLLIRQERARSQE